MSNNKTVTTIKQAIEGFLLSCKVVSRTVERIWKDGWSSPTTYFERIHGGGEPVIKGGDLRSASGFSPPPHSNTTKEKHLNPV
jgi:hypothetical protein